MLNFAGGHIFNLSRFTQCPVRDVLGERGPQKPGAFKFNLYSTKKYFQGTLSEFLLLNDPLIQVKTIDRAYWDLVRVTT